MVRVTVVMPCYNGVRFIDQAIESVLSQTLTDLQLVVSAQIVPFSTVRLITMWM